MPTRRQLHLMLKELDLKSFYTKETDVLEVFYHPCVRESHYYDRISGYFSSAIFDLAGSAFFDFFSRGGKMRLVCSPFLQRRDINALSEEDEASSLESLLADPATRSSASILAYLVASGLLDLRIAIDESSDGLLHEKIGIFSDSTHSVSFNGSINETHQGWSRNGNRESFDVFVSWLEQDASRIGQHKSEFENLWNGRVSGILVRKVTKAFMRIVSKISEAGEQEYKKRSDLNPAIDFMYDPLEYQKDVIRNWKDNKNQGIVKFCTGAGKTVVGMLGVKWATEHGLPSLIVVPSKTLMYQWEEEVKKMASERSLASIFRRSSSNTAPSSHSNIGHGLQ
jgi:hypothetical protein